MTDTINRIYTSYFDNRRLRGKHNDMFFIPICGRVYVWNGYSDHYKELAPDRELVEWLYDQPEITPSVRWRFIKTYLKKLRSLRKKGVLSKYVYDLRLRQTFQDVVLLCYEKPPQFCHRYILAKYLNKYYDLKIREY